MKGHDAQEMHLVFCLQLYGRQVAFFATDVERVSDAIKVGKAAQIGSLIGCRILLL